ncbi:MAG: DRTGG domain-containing protein [Candidatus Hermodarchaeota archaeon]
MKKLVIASEHPNAGKTSIILGLAKATGKKFGYMKPFGDRLLYRKKRLWDYDSALLTNIFGLKEKPEDISIGFEHSKLRYIYDEKTTKEKLFEMVETVGKGQELLFIEAGKDLMYGSSIHLDAISLAESIDCKFVLVISGDQDRIMDDIIFARKYLGCFDKAELLGGVIINKVQDVDDFKNTYLESIEEMNIPVFGIIPYKHKMTYLTMDRIAEVILGKVLTAKDSLNNVVDVIFVGAMSANAALRNPLFSKKRKLIITGGDREDMILAALREDTDTAGLILTNNVVPSSQTISKAEDRNVPMLLTSMDTFRAAKACDDMEPLITKDATRKIETITELVKNHVDIKELLNS